MNSDSPRTRTAQARYMIARAWHSKGSIAAAMAAYREALALDPAHLESAILLGALLHAERRLQEAIDIYRQALEHHPNEARLHKELVNVVLTQEGPDAIFREYRLERKDSKYLNPEPADVICCVVLRNELLRLPYFLRYYRNKGIARFFAVDNGSSDGSLEYLLEQPDVYVWRSDLSFNRANFGAGWFEPILRLHARGRWCLIVDADELLYYPECERRSIPDLCRRLDAKKKRAFNAIHLDMYSGVSLRETRYTSGRRFEDVCPYFDHQFYHQRIPEAGPFHNETACFGGVRKRIFGDGVEYYLSKVPLIKYGVDCILAGGQHRTNLSLNQIAAESGCLLHFKFFSFFHDRAAEEAGRKEHYGAAEQYREYHRGLREQPDLTFFDPAHSVRLEDSRQLLRLGIMQADESADAATEVVFPKIEAVVSAYPRPFWSVMLTVYRRTQYLEQALRSVLAQAPGPEEMQIEVVSDGAEDSLQNEIEAMVRAMAGDRVAAYRQIPGSGHPEIFNVCVRRARGLWVHLLHDDDWVAPGFYAALEKGIGQAPEVAAAFCRHAFVDEQGCTLRLSSLEREAAGILDDWLDRIGSACLLQTPSIVVRREAYERLGGYCPQAKSAFDWEMWQRLAVHYPVWYEPRPLAYFRQGRESESARLVASGGQIADTRAVMRIARGYIPNEKANALSRRAGEHYALWALELAERQMKAGNVAGALANLREGVQCSGSEEVTRKILDWLLRAPADS